MWTAKAGGTTAVMGVTGTIITTMDITTTARLAFAELY